MPTKTKKTSWWLGGSKEKPPKLRIPLCNTCYMQRITGYSNLSNEIDLEDIERFPQEDTKCSQSKALTI